MKLERRITLEGEDHIVLISDEPEALLAAKAAGRAVVGVERPEADSRFMEGIFYVVPSVEAATDELAELVRRGEKTATASAYPLYELAGDPLPKEGEYSVILNSREEAVCIIRTTKVYVAPFCEITESHAFKEGEGDKSLSYWRKVHEEFFKNALERKGLNFDEQMKVVCEEFEVLYA